jgi:hypothetical protein
MITEVEPEMRKRGCRRRAGALSRDQLTPVQLEFAGTLRRRPLIQIVALHG